MVDTKQSVILQAFKKLNDLKKMNLPSMKKYKFDNMLAMRSYSHESSIAFAYFIFRNEKSLLNILRISVFARFHKLWLSKAIMSTADLLPFLQIPMIKDTNETLKLKYIHSEQSDNHKLDLTKTLKSLFLKRNFKAI